MKRNWLTDAVLFWSLVFVGHAVAWYLSCEVVSELPPFYDFLAGVVLGIPLCLSTVVWLHFLFEGALSESARIRAEYRDDERESVDRIMHAAAKAARAFAIVAMFIMPPKRNKP